MKNQFLGIFFYLLYLVAMVKPVLPVIEYYANYDYIAAVLCENKSKPYLECNGKCYLQKQIEKLNSNNRKHNSTIPSIDLKDYPVSPINRFSYQIADEENNFLEKNNSQSSLNAQLYTFYLFKPPRA